MPHIQNVAAADISTGFHYPCGENSMLIQIADPCGSFPTPKHRFKENYQYCFLDVENDNECADEFGIRPEQAKGIVAHLKHALQNNMNVVVHCTAGVCRSGAVIDVATMMGFEDPQRFRAPNLMVKHALMKELGWTYDSEEKPTGKFVEAPEDIDFMRYHVIPREVKSV